jgi:1-deoxy-D-xylulose-5-phosphate reductoisomerase
MGDASAFDPAAGGEAMTLPARVSILGVTGSVGASTVAVLEEARAAGREFAVEALTAGRNVEGLVAAGARLGARFLAIGDASCGPALKQAAAHLGIETGAGQAAIVEAAARDAEWVMAAIVGAAGLEPTMAAIERGATVALANKEALVCAGGLMTAAAARSNARLVPVDSEHSAIFQVWEGVEHVERVTLTASGGPFRTWTRDEMAVATPEQAAKHPTWSMGPKITIDSATLMNKGFEVIEAAHLFGLGEDRLGVLVHPQSIIHSLVHYVDGSVLAQLSVPDMRLPIAYALSVPERLRVSTPRLDLAAIVQLTFEAPDEERFPALGLIRAAMRSGGGVSCGLNAANEISVQAFLEGRIGFLQICEVNSVVLEQLIGGRLASIAKSPSSLDQVRSIDLASRTAAVEAVKALGG